MALWLAGYKLATLLDVFRPYSSLWFLPAGITLSIFLAAPGVLKLAPLAANLLLVSPEISPFFIENNGGALAQALHAIRHCGIYGLVAYTLIGFSGPTQQPLTLRATLVFVSSVLLASCVAAISGVSLHAWAGNMSWAEGWGIVFQWATGDAIAALVLPPILVPLLRAAFAEPIAEWRWPRASSWLVQIGFITLALLIGSQAVRLNPQLGSLWYLMLIPPIIAGVTGGLPTAAISVFFTSLATPLAAYLLAYDGEMLALSLLLAIGAIAALLIGAAVSDQRRALAQVEGQRQFLEQTVAERTVALTDAHAFQSHLVRSLGHDLRQPLQTITMLLDGMAMGSTADQAALVQTRKISGTMTDFLDGILNYARHDTGVISPVLSVFPVSRVFAKLNAVYEPIAASRSIDLVTTPSDALLVSDEMLLSQALSNDLDNAIRLSQSGMAVTLLHEVRDGRDAIVVVDQLPTTTAKLPGSAGFGQGIVNRISVILGAARIENHNEYGLSLPPSLPIPTPKASVHTPNS
ncbi:sensor histidine kinase [Devosia sp. A369]